MSLLAQEAPKQSPLEERLQKLWTTLGRQQVADAWKMPNEERKHLLSEFNKRLFAGKWGPPDSWDNGDSIRRRLGDRELTKSEVQKVVDGHDYGLSLARSGSPIAIEYLAPYAFSEEPYQQIQISDVITAPLSFIVTSRIFEILSESPAFTDEVNQWARKEKVPDPEKERAELQRWWTENKIHFENEDYKAVKPGRPITSAFEVMNEKRRVEDERRRKAGLPSLLEELNEMRRKNGGPPLKELP